MLPLAEVRKILVTFRLELGCLGPQGRNHVDEFCTFAQQEFEANDEGYAHWNIIPRHNKSLPEMEYTWHGKKISRHQAERYLHALEHGMDEFEDDAHEKLVHLIEVYFERHQQVGKTRVR